MTTAAESIDLDTLMNQAIESALPAEPLPRSLELLKPPFPVNGMQAIEEDDDSEIEVELFEDRFAARYVSSPVIRGDGCACADDCHHRKRKNLRQRSIKQPVSSFASHPALSFARFRVHQFVRLSRTCAKKNQARR